ncbi:MAG: glutathione S-transferase N-terminal domain-containing protein [Gammaproteobacteria bacterium]|nr:glutathione S-transferase N-terminal domain-containing protein [Gammaproteobacteria bacterium]
MFDGGYTLWGGEHSLFTRKLQAMLNYLAVDYEFRLKSAEAAPAVEARLGTHRIPGLETPEGWFIHDTTPIGLMLHGKYPDRPILPSVPRAENCCPPAGGLGGRMVRPVRHQQPLVLSAQRRARRQGLLRESHRQVHGRGTHGGRGIRGCGTDRDGP